MKFLVNQINEQKYFEMQVDSNKFIQDNGITPQMVIYEMHFDKKVFKEEKEVREYLSLSCTYNFTLEDEGTYFLVKLVSEYQVDSDKEIEIELRRGLVVKAADLLPLALVADVMFSEKSIMGCDLNTINLHEGLPHIIEIARVAEGDHPSYGKISITKDTLKTMQANFQAKVTGVDLAVNEDHSKNEAFGWFKDVFLSYDEETLYGQIQWNTKGIRALSEKEYRYFSPEFRFNYVHPHTGVSHGATLMGGALTNYPFLKMDAIVELANKQETKGVKMSTQTIELSTHIALSEKLNTVQFELSESKKQNVELSSEVKTLKETVSKMEKASVHKKLFDDGKINAAQLVALNEGKNLIEVLALSEKLNTQAAGQTTSTKDSATVELSEDEKKVCKQMGLTEQEYRDANK